MTKKFKLLRVGARDRTWTDTDVTPQDFKSCASADSATRACVFVKFSVFLLIFCLFLSAKNFKSLASADSATQAFGLFNCSFYLHFAVQRLLSPVRLPIPPLGHVFLLSFQFFCQKFVSFYLPKILRVAAGLLHCNTHRRDGLFSGDERKKECFKRKRLKHSFWRRHPDLNRGMRVLQTLALPLGYSALKK